MMAVKLNEMSMTDFLSFSKRIFGFLKEEGEAEHMGIFKGGFKGFKARI